MAVLWFFGMACCTLWRGFGCTPVDSLCPGSPRLSPAGLWRVAGGGLPRLRSPLGWTACQSTPYEDPLRFVLESMPELTALALEPAAVRPVL